MMTAPHDSPSSASTARATATREQPTPQPNASGAPDRVLPLLRGALPPALAVWVVTILGGWVLGGGAAALGAVAGGGVVVVFSGTGLFVLRLLRNADPMLTMIAGLGSYLLRIVLFGAAVAVANAIPNIDAVLDRNAVMVAVLLTVTAWLAGEIRAFTRLRIPIFDVSLPHETGATAPDVDEQSSNSSSRVGTDQQPSTADGTADGVAHAKGEDAGHEAARGNGQVT